MSGCWYCRRCDRRFETQHEFVNHKATCVRKPDWNALVALVKEKK